MRTLIKTAIAAFAIALAPGAALASGPACEAAPLLLQDVTIVDASGSWDHQDIFIEAGRISAIGEDLVLETGQTVTVLGRSGAIVRPRPRQAVQSGAIFIRTSTRSASATPRATVLLPGAPADLLVYAGEPDETGLGRVELEIEAGHILGASVSCRG